MKSEDKSNKNIKQNIDLDVEIIKIKIDKVAYAYSPYSDDENKILNKHVVEFLDESIKNVNPKSALQIDVNVGERLTNKEKCNFATSFKSYYRNAINEINQSNILFDIISFTMLFVGVIFLVLATVLTSQVFLLVEICEIIAWVFVWEFVHVFVFKRLTKLNIKRKMQRIYNATINFV